VSPLRTWLLGIGQARSCVFRRHGAHCGAAERSDDRRHRQRGAAFLSQLNGIIQGAGTGFIFVPLSVISLATLAPEQRAEGAGFYTLARNLGMSVGTSIVTALLTTNAQINHADISNSVTGVNRLFANPNIAHLWSPYTAAGRAALNAIVYGSGADHRLYR
jgi:MFS family permease